MTSDRTKFTVIVPTRERADTLRHCLQTIVRQRYDNLEILVSDNFSHDDTERVVHSFGDSRIKYVNTGSRVDMSSNFEFALSHVKNGWVSYVGDDDGLLPNALAIVNEIIEKTGSKVVSSKWHHYTWPNFEGTTPPNRLTVSTGTGYEIRNARTALTAVLKGRLSYTELPGIYAGGFADYETLNQLRNQTGKLFCSRTPDVYAAIALSSTLRKYVFSNQPLSICGASAHSIGASTFGYSTNSAAGELYFSEGKIPFYSTLGDGRVKSIQLLVYEAYMQASHLHGSDTCTSIPEQLALALSESENTTRDLESYCKQIAENHGLDFQRIMKTAKTASIRRKVRTIYKKVWSPFVSFEVDGGRLGVSDVSDATIACQSLYFQATSNKSWKAHKAFHKFFRKNS